MLSNHYERQEDLQRLEKIMNKQTEEPKKQKVVMLPGISLDGGTMNLISARRTVDGIKIKRIRDLFLDLPKEASKMLKLAGTDFIERADDLVVIGDQALQISNVFGKEARRPLSSGLVSPKEIDSFEILSLLIKQILGEPLELGEYCYFSIPAIPVDKPEESIIYHKGVLEKIISDCGYTPIAANEAMAIIYSETAAENFSGIGMSFGAGLTNVALAVNTIEGLSFSVNRAGDWIDRGAANSIGSTQARMCSIKERGMDLNHPQNREQEAIAFYYRALIEYVLDQIINRFRAIQNQFALPKPIPIVVAGGTSLAGGFMEFFTKVFESKKKRFPIEISEIRQAKDPLNAIALGLLVQAGQEYV